MESQTHSIANLFAQLGLPDESAAIDAFIASHPLPHDVQLFDAPFWSAAQAAFLKTEIAEDADWSPVIDTLDARLRVRQ
ncbi:DUF2789 domain-containing protein [Zoogloea sp.]|uniref:DUF2789 domain-containing protein n=1 Tax=Zoogloea sp. TaxID=49181 RepID=UPI0014166547|nr:MAG: DUF2789 domain-containing protein [Zoogloea sp.]